MRIRTLVTAAVAALLLAPLSACSSPNGFSTADAPAMPGIDAAPMTDARSLVTEDGASVGSQTADRSIILSGDLSLEVRDVAGAADEIRVIADDLGGRVENESLSRATSEFPASGYLALRVPAERLDEAFTALSEVGEVRSQSRSATDVTAQHVDLQARVEALEQSVQRLTELMAGSATTGELIEAESALAQRQQELDGLRAQLAALEGQVEEAAIAVSLSTESALPGGPGNFWDGLVAGWDSLVAAGAGALVVLGILLPWLALAGVIALVVVLIVRARRRAGRARE